MLPLSSALTSVRPFAHHTVIRSGLPAPWGLILTLGRPHGALPKGSGNSTEGIEDTRAQASDSPCPQATTRAHPGATDHSGQEKGQSPPSPQLPLEAPRYKTLGPMLPSPAPSTGHAPPLAPQPAAQACWPLGANPTLVSPRGALPKGPGAATLGMGDPRAPAPDSPYHQAATRAHQGASDHSGQENGQGPQNPR